MLVEIAASLSVVAASTACFMTGARCGVEWQRRRRGRRSLAGYAVPALFSMLALSMAAQARGDDIYLKEHGIWKTQSDVYTNMPHRYAGEARRVEVGYGRWTPVVGSTSPRAVAAVVAVRVVPYSAERPLCIGAFLGNALVSGGATVCRGERAVVRQERVLRRGSIVTTTDTVLIVGKREVMRIQGSTHEHSPTKTRLLP